MAPISLDDAVSTNGHTKVPKAVNTLLTNGLSPRDLSSVPNPSLQVTADHNIKLVPAPIPTPSPTQVLIHVKATGICGSDIHFWKRGAIGTLTVDGDCILGHEGAGIIIGVGSAVTGLKIGDRVAIEPGVPCGSCFLCRAGRYNLCEDVAFAGAYPYGGTLRRIMAHESKWVHKIPDNMTFNQAALLEPLSVVMHGINSTSLSLGRPVLICGAGPIGLIALAAAKASGAFPLVITDLDPGRLEFARRFVPGCQTYQIRRDLDAWNNAEAIRALFGVDTRVKGSKSEYEYIAPATVLECTGVESSIVTSCYVCRRGGTVMVIGVGRDIVNNLPFMHVSLAEINLKFINRYRDTWPAGIIAISSGIVNLDPLITHTFPLEKAIDAMELCQDITKGSIKVQIVDEQDLL